MGQLVIHLTRKDELNKAQATEEIANIQIAHETEYRIFSDFKETITQQEIDVAKGTP